MKISRYITILTCCIAICLPLGQTQLPAADTPKAPPAKTAADATARGLTWLDKNQKADGSWGKTYTVAITSLACLSYLAASDEPFTGDHADHLMKGLTYLMKTQTAGQWPTQGHSWIHGQGFATLALSEAVGRSRLCKIKPDTDVEKLAAVVTAAVKIISDNQSTSGGWWYTPGAKSRHEGSTTVCAVQALVSAANYGFTINTKSLGRGFEYLKKCQNADGGFDYSLDNSPNTRSMKEGTAADVATLGLMRKFDYAVMINGYQFLLKLTPAGISKERFPYYGHFYGCMGMRLLGQEFKSFRTKTDAYTAAAVTDVMSWQQTDGSWPMKGSWWSGQAEGKAYSTAFASLLLQVDGGHLSIFNRKPPKLPAEVAEPAKAAGA